jgi:hypothetical protein
MQQALINVAGKDYEPVLLEMQADADAYYGRMARSRQSSKRAIELDAKAGSSSSVAFRESWPPNEKPKSATWHWCISMLFLP